LGLAGNEHGPARGKRKKAGPATRVARSGPPDSGLHCQLLLKTRNGMLAEERWIRNGSNGSHPSSSPARVGTGSGEGRGLEGSPAAGNHRRGDAAMLSTVPELLVLVASPEVAPIDGAFAAVLAVLRRAIEVAPATMWRGRWSRKLRGERGGEWCEEWRLGRPPFIGLQGGRGGAGRWMVAMGLEVARGQWSGCVLLAMSWWS
jgi:hypothetical protein